MPPCGSDGSLPSRPQWTALFDIVLSVFECMCIFSLFYYYCSALLRVVRRVVRSVVRRVGAPEERSAQATSGVLPA